MATQTGECQIDSIEGRIVCGWCEGSDAELLGGLRTGYWESYYAG